MIMRFRFDYDQAQVVKQMSAASYAALRAVVPDLAETQGDVWSHTDYEGDVEKVIEIVGPVTVTGKMTPWITAQFVAMAKRLDTVESRQNVEQTVNQKVNVHVPGFGLLSMEKVCVEEDCCTNRLQELLDQGWRILAICPQPDQRRPDYVLGRSRKADED